MLKIKILFLTVLTMAAVVLSSCNKRDNDNRRAMLIDKLGKGADEKIVLDIFYDNLFIDTKDEEDSGYSQISTAFSADEKKALGGTGVLSHYDDSGKHVIRGMQVYTCFDERHKNYQSSGANVNKILFDFKYYIDGSHGRYGLLSFLSKDAIVNITIKTRYRSKVSLISKKNSDLKVVNNDKPASTTLFLDRGEYTIKVYNGKSAK